VGFWRKELRMKDKYETLEDKLIELSDCIDEIHVDDKTAADFLVSFHDYVKRLIQAAHRKVMIGSETAMMGLSNWLAGYRGFKPFEKLWKLASDVDRYYYMECRTFT